MMYIYIYILRNRKGVRFGLSHHLIFGPHTTSERTGLTMAPKTNEGLGVQAAIESMLEVPYGPYALYYWLVHFGGVELYECKGLDYRSCRCWELLDELLNQTLP